jgi:6,7-dimethyl-8-ribityllumazine synthase
VPDERAVEDVRSQIVEEPVAPAEPEPEAGPDPQREPVPPGPEEPGQEHAPGRLEIPPGVAPFVGAPNGDARTVGIAVARFNGDITTRLLEGAVARLEEAGVSRDRVDVVQVPGAFELPLAAMALARTRRYACVLALGCVIRGDTPHFDYVCAEAASGIQLAMLETGVPVSFGVLTCDDRAQAEERAGGAHGNKGAEAAESALEMADVFSRVRADGAP